MENQQEVNYGETAGGGLWRHKLASVNNSFRSLQNMERSEVVTSGLPTSRLVSVPRESVTKDRGFISSTYQLWNDKDGPGSKASNLATLVPF